MIDNREFPDTYFSPPKKPLRSKIGAGGGPQSLKSGRLRAYVAVRDEDGNVVEELVDINAEYLNRTNLR